MVRRWRFTARRVVVLTVGLGLLTMTPYVLSAFGRAEGQGTMNNLTLGDSDFTYYETLGGGQGA